jgi:hypothetical protein
MSNYNYYGILLPQEFDVYCYKIGDAVNTIHLRMHCCPLQQIIEYALEDINTFDISKVYLIEAERWITAGRSYPELKIKSIQELTKNQLENYQLLLS